VGRCERGNRNARIYANRPGAGDESLFAARRLESVRPLSRSAAGTPELADLSGISTKNEGSLVQSHVFGLSLDRCER
jgi:hypothetical protein